MNRSATIQAARRVTVLAGFFIAALTANASARPQQSSVGSTDSLRTLTDDMGRSIRVAPSVRRIVSLSPSMTEIVYAVGSQDQLVGDTNYCDYPPDAAKKHKVGDVLNPSLEEIASLKPDLVLVTSSNRWQTVYALERLGIPSYAGEPRTLDEIRALIRHLAVVFGKPEAGDSLDSNLQHKMEGLLQKLQNVKPAHVLFVVWKDPLISVGKNTFIGDALVHAGAQSVVESSQDWPKVSLEEVAHLQPDLLIFASDHPENVARDVEVLSRRPDWNSLDAIKHRRYIVVSEAVNRPGPRLFDTVEDLARQLHPDAFTQKSEAAPASPAPSSKGSAPKGPSQKDKD